MKFDMTEERINQLLPLWMEVAASGDDLVLASAAIGIA